MSEVSETNNNQNRKKEISKNIKLAIAASVLFVVATVFFISETFLPIQNRPTSLFGLNRTGQNNPNPASVQTSPSLPVNNSSNPSTTKNNDWKKDLPNGALTLEIKGGEDEGKSEEGRSNQIKLESVTAEKITEIIPKNLNQFEKPGIRVDDLSVGNDECRGDYSAVYYQEKNKDELIGSSMRIANFNQTDLKNKDIQLTLNLLETGEGWPRDGTETGQQIHPLHIFRGKCLFFYSHLLKDLGLVFYPSTDKARLFYITEGQETSGGKIYILAKKGNNFILLEKKGVVPFQIGFYNECGGETSKFDQSCYRQKLIQPQFIEEVKSEVKKLIELYAI